MCFFYQFASSVVQTIEMVKSDTLESLGSAILNSTANGLVSLPMDNFKLAAGAFKLRANFTDKNHAWNFASLSDEFYIVTESPCVGLQSGNSTASGGDPASSATGTASALSNRTTSFTGLSRGVHVSPRGIIYDSLLAVFGIKQ
ncbi:hypothetical protein K438DRAFT_1945762 [Mycena galopus ATCC 62051]|nr:hypothetical protein K438DRAFT_1945762 [Mycena galopus ATCC 62051]